MLTFANKLMTFEINSMRKTCVKHAHNQRQTCGRLSTNLAIIKWAEQHHVDNQRLIHDTILSQSTVFSTDTIPLLPLSEHNFYLVSTVPIITNR